jgi:hypothetical protein
MEEVFSTDNETLWVTPMVMSGSHYPDLSWTLQEAEGEIMKDPKRSSHDPIDPSPILAMK